MTGVDQGGDVDRAKKRDKLENQESSVVVKPKVSRV